MQFPATLPLVGRKTPNPGTKWNFLFWIYPFQAISSNFGFSWQLSSPQGPKRQNFRLDLFISGNCQQLWVQLAVKLPPGAKQAKILNCIYSFQALSSNFGFSWQLSLQSENSKFLFWIYPFHAISSNFAFSWQKSPIPIAKQGLFQTGFIHFRQFPANLPLAGRKAPLPVAKQRHLFRLELSISGNFQQFWFQLVENASS